MIKEILRHIYEHSEEYKVGTFNAIAFMISFANVEDVLKIILLLVTIIYTSYKIVDLHHNRKKKK